MENEIMYIKLDDIIPNRFQPRERFDEEELQRLAESIRKHGVIEPILVRPISNKYEIVAGERRYKASVLAGLTKIPAMVKQLDDKESSIMAFIENNQRSDVSAVEEARTMDRILKANNMTQEELALELGVNQSTIANKLRLLNLPYEVQEAVIHNEISERHARSLLSVKDELKQIELLEKIKEKKMTVRELDSEIKNMNGNMSDYNEMNFGFEKESNNNVGYMDNSIPGVPNYFGEENKTTESKINQQEENEFMSYLNNYETKEPTPREPITLNEQTPNDTPAANDFRNFLNNYNNNPLPEEAKPEVSEEPTDEGFMSFLNNYDANNPLPEEAKPEASEEPTDEGFMSYLNNYDANNPLPEEAKPEVSEEPTDEGFMNFLNNYENSNPLSSTSDLKANNTPVEENLYGAFNNPTNSNLSINSVTPPITSNFGSQYVEDSENYVDISKQDRITNVDEIIEKFGEVVKEVKEKSIFKIETDEINYDDIYQITIRIDKRNF